MPELERNILNFGYGINFQYEGRLATSFDRFYVVTKFVLPTMEDLKSSPIEFDSSCNYLNVKIGDISDAFPINHRVKQGCILAPTLFTLYLETVLETTSANLASGIYI